MFKLIVLLCCWHSQLFVAGVILLCLSYWYGILIKTCPCDRVNRNTKETTQLPYNMWKFHIPSNFPGLFWIQVPTGSSWPEDPGSHLEHWVYQGRPPGRVQSPCSLWGGTVSHSAPLTRDRRMALLGLRSLIHRHWQLNYSMGSTSWSSTQQCNQPQDVGLERWKLVSMTSMGNPTSNGGYALWLTALFWS